QLLAGCNYGYKFLSWQANLALVGLALLACMRPERRWTLSYAAAAAIAYVAFITLIGGDWMPMHRFYVAVLPFLCVLAGLGVGQAIGAAHVDAREILRCRPAWSTAPAALLALYVGCHWIGARNEYNT